MAAPLMEPRYSPEEYLALERAAEYKSEYIDGHIIAMSGASKEHGLISMNLSRVLAPQLIDQPCDTYASEMRVRIRTRARSNARNAYFYPDFVVSCGDPQYDDSNLDTMLNPTLVIEILSPSTQGYDRSEKFTLYLQIASLQEFLLISQDRCFVEHYVRVNGGWHFTYVDELADVLQLPSINCELPLAEVYRKVSLPIEDPEE